MDDIGVLTKITQYVNGLHARGRMIAGVLYLHDVSLAKMRSGGLRNLEMLPKLVGRQNLVFCTLVTTHWNHLIDPSKEVNNEKLLKTTAAYWKPLLEGPNPALYAKFEKNAESGIKILIPHLNDRFELQITDETVRQKLPYGQTSAGKAVQQNIDKHVLAESARDKTKIAQLRYQKQQAEQALKQNHDAERDKRYALACRELRKQRTGHRIVRWTFVGTGIVTTAVFAVLAAGVTGGALAVPIGSALVGLSGFGLAAATTWASTGSGRDQKRQAALDAEYHKDMAGRPNKTSKKSELDLEYESSDEDDSTLYELDAKINL